MLETSEIETYLLDLVKQLDNPKHFENAENAARFAREVRTMFDRMSHLRKIAESVNTALKERVPEVFAEAGVSSISIDGYRFVATSTLRASIIKDQKVEAYNWLRENDLESLITETVNASTLSAAARVQLDNGYELNADYFRTYHQPNLSITKVG